jgi:uncharacterized membrane protein
MATGFAQSTSANRYAKGTRFLSYFVQYIFGKYVVSAMQVFRLNSGKVLPKRIPVMPFIFKMWSNGKTAAGLVYFHKLTCEFCFYLHRPMVPKCRKTNLQRP